MRNSMPILLVEDDCTDAIIFKRALKEAEITNPLVHLINCKVALEYLRDQNNIKPWLIITDLNTPEMNTFEFLEVIKADEALKQIPVIILTGSGDENDVTECFRLGAAGYMVKPNEYKKFLELISAIHSYWILVASISR